MMKKTLSLGLLSVFVLTATFGGFVGNQTAFAANTQAEAKANAQANWASWFKKPAITTIDPEAGPTGTTITLTGKRFTEDSVVRFGQGVVNDTDVSDDGKTLSFVLPEEMGTYCPPFKVCTAIAMAVEAGDYKVRVQNGYRASNAVWYEVTSGTTTATSTDEELVIEKISGPTVLEVDAEGTWVVDVASELEGNLEYSVKWGDEASGLMRLFALSPDATQSSSTFTHTYTEPGTYQPEFTVTDAEGNTVTKLAEKVVVGDDGAPVLTAISVASGQVGKSVTLTGTGFDADSKVMIGATTSSDVVVVSNTEITFTIPSVAAGTYDVSVMDNDGTSNVLSFTVTVEAVKGKLSVQGINAPTKLMEGQEGTWTVKASTNLEGNLTYSVDWGDSAPSMRSALSAETVQSDATFTHTYEEAGMYKPTFTVTDEDGRTAKVSATVKVVAASS